MKAYDHQIEESHQKSFYKKAFLEKNKEYQKIRADLDKLRKIRAEKGDWSSEELNRHYNLILKFIEYSQDSISPLTTSIEMMVDRIEDVWTDLDYDEWNYCLEKSVDFSEEFLRAINRVNKKDKTIVVKIHLDQNITDIISDMTFLLDLLDKEARIYGVNFGRKKKRPTKESHSIYEKYALYLRVMYLHKDKGKPWKEIAYGIYRDEIEAGKMSLEKAKERVRKHYDQALNLANEDRKQI